ncbi:MAG: hypothetical protein IJU91_10585 [Selenomonadaceae bacterium]|nr:hypothetical protein [Selenomonadaceae bacterium]
MARRYHGTEMNQRGFMLLSTVFLTLILSFTAMLALQAMTRVQNGDQSLKLHAINLANEQLAMVESLAAQNNLAAVKNFNGNDADLQNYGLYDENAEDKPPVEFNVTTNINAVNENLREVEVTVTWNENEISFKKLVRVNSP